MLGVEFSRDNTECCCLLSYLDSCGGSLVQARGTQRTDRSSPCSDGPGNGSVDVPQDTTRSTSHTGCYPRFPLSVDRRILFELIFALQDAALRRSRGCSLLPPKCIALPRDESDKIHRSKVIGIEPLMLSLFRVALPCSANLKHGAQALHA